MGLAVAAACLSATPAAADQATLPGGTAIAVDIEAPSNGGYVATGAVEVSGTASVAEGVAAPDVTVVYVLDVSLSTAFTAGANCDGASGNDSILKCEIAAVKSVNADAKLSGSPVLNSGVVTFNTTATIRDVNRLQAGVQRLAPPGPGVDAAVGGLVAFGGTLYGPGLAAAANVLADPSAGRDQDRGVRDRRRRKRLGAAPPRHDRRDVPDRGYGLRRQPALVQHGLPGRQRLGPPRSR